MALRAVQSSASVFGAYCVSGAVTLLVGIPQLGRSDCAVPWHDPVEPGGPGCYIHTGQPYSNGQSLRESLRALVSAYACEPGRGSEPGVGWSWAREIARFHEVWVITRFNNREPIEGALAANLF